MATGDPPRNISYAPLPDEDEEPSPQQPPLLQPVTIQAQPPPPQTGVQYYVQPNTGAVFVQPQAPPTAVLVQPEGSTSYTYLPECALISSIVTLLTCTTLMWLPGFLCLAPAMILGIVAVSKKEDNKPSEAKMFSTISLVLLVVFAASYPVLLIGVILAGMWARY